MGEGRVHRSCAVSTAAACCVLCLLCHHGAPCDAQLEPGVQADAAWPGNEQVLALLLQRYGDGKAISQDGFEMLLNDLKLGVPPKLGNKQKLVSGANSTHGHAKTAVVCENISAARRLAQTSLSAKTVRDVCPALLVQLVAPSVCPEESLHDHHHELATSTEQESNRAQVWLYATGSIVIISACGLLAVAVIPIMQRMFYQQMLQFLVSLAVGSLCGDALLHLLPHAMSGGHSESHEHHHHEGDDHDNTNLWRGLVALAGIVFFFFTEKCLTLAGEWRRRTQRKKKLQGPSKVVRVVRDAELQGSSSVGEKLCKHKYSSYPYCYAEITGGEEGEKKAGAPPPETPAAATETLLTVPVAAPPEPPTPPPPAEVKVEEGVPPVEGEGYTVILKEHTRSHHGHSHSHGHVHSAPPSLSAVAWMVVMGDGLHNLTDGLAIGAAFAASIPGGLSTAIAVFCHELPHELGDFAVLLKAGMSAKQAVCYNMLSSALCFLGMLLGVSLGHSEAIAQWVFAAAAGMFLYIALVDMIPELTGGHSEEAAGSSWLQTLLLQLCGMMTGLGIMLLIALYENDLHTIFSD